MADSLVKHGTSPMRNPNLHLDEHGSQLTKHGECKPALATSTSCQDTTAPLSPVDQPIFCQPCKEKETGMRITNVIEGRRRFRGLPSQGNHPRNLSCPSCRLLDYTEKLRRKNYVGKDTDKVFLYFFPNSGKSSARAGGLAVIDLLLENSLGVNRVPHKGHEVDIEKFKQVMDCRKFDCSRLKSKIDGICRADRAHPQAQERQRVTGLRVINCHTRKVVQAPADSDYIALSYVWGPPSQPVGDLQHLPRTIEDALSVTTALGYQFLWVDRYCINQESHEERHSQIGQMGRIYSQAIVTIIAAAGQDPSYGLPGISLPRKQSSIAFGQYNLHPLHHTPQELVSTSVWISRAWTYQEYVLSRLRLFFTDEYAFLECKEMMVEEWPATAWKNAYVEPPQKNAGIRFSEGGSGIKGGGALGEILSFDNGVSDYDRFCETIRRYTKRSLTYSSDLLNGILGVLSTFEDCPTPIYHLHGLPYTFGNNKAQLQLLWFIFLERKVAGERWVTRRPEFPSWSWTGWREHPQLNNKEITNYTDLHFIPIPVEVELEKRAGTLSLEEYTSRRLSGEKLLASSCIWVKGWTRRVEIEPYHFNEGFRDRSCPRETLVNASFTMDDLASRKRPFGTFIALLVGWCIYYYTSGDLLFLLIDETTESAERVGILRVRFELRLSERDLEVTNTEQAVSMFRNLFPSATEKHILLS